MNKRPIIIGAGAVAVAAALIVAIVVQSNADSPDSASTPKPSNTAVAELPTGTTPSATPAPGTAVEGDPAMPGGTTEDGFGAGAPDGGDGLDLPDDGTVALVNARDFRATAEAAVRAYATVTPNETSAQRAARLAPYFPVGSKHLTEKPRIANPQSYVGIIATVTPGTSTASSAAPVSATDTSYSWTVTMDYTGVYDASGNKMTISKQATWTVSMNTTYDGLVQTITEPTDLR